MPMIRLGKWPAMVSQWPPDPAFNTIIFIHGASHCASFWVQQVKDLSGSANCLAVDLPGHGLRSDAGMSKIDDYAECLLEFIEQNQIVRPIVCGLSMGGAIAQHLLINHSRHFAGGILCNTGARLKVTPKIFAAIEADYNAFVKMIYQFGIAPENRNPILWQKLMAISSCRPEVALGDFRACDAFDVMDQLNGIEKPVLVVTAEKDLLTPVKYGSYLAQQIKGASLATVAGAGHFAPLEKPETVSGLIENFIKQLPGKAP